MVMCPHCRKLPGDPVSSLFKTGDIPDEPSMSQSSAGEFDDDVDRVLSKLAAIGLNEIRSEDVFERPKSINSTSNGLAKKDGLVFYEQKQQKEKTLSSDSDSDL